MSNISGIALPSAARTVATNSADLGNPDGRGVMVFLDVTAITLTPILTLSVQGKDPASGKYVTLFTGAAVSTISTTTYVVYPGITETANVDASVPIPEVFRIAIAVADADSATYSVGYSTLM